MMAMGRAHPVLIGFAIAAAAATISCRTTPTPEPPPSNVATAEAQPPESHEEATARCVRELSTCKYAAATEVVERDPLAWCDNRGVMPGPGDPCYQRHMRARSHATYQCICDECRSPADCGPDQQCVPRDPCARTRDPFTCRDGKGPGALGCPDRDRPPMPYPAAVPR